MRCYAVMHENSGMYLKDVNIITREIIATSRIENAIKFRSLMPADKLADTISREFGRKWFSVVAEE